MTRLARYVVDHYLLLPLGAAIAVVWANTGAESYFRLSEALAFAVNDIGMAFAFAFVMQEVVEAMLPGGVLHPWRRAVLPIVAAAGGTVGAIAVFALYVRSAADEPALAAGWPIACAVDIVVGLALARSIFRRHPAITLLLLVIVASDAIGLVLVSGRYPVADVHPAALLLMIAAVAVAASLRRARVRTFGPYVVVGGTLSWLALYWSGLHPALALLPIVPFLPHARRDVDHLLNERDNEPDDESDGDGDNGPDYGPHYGPHYGPDDGHNEPGKSHMSATHFEYAFRYPVQVVAFLFGLVNGGVLMRGHGAGTWAVLAAALVGRPVGILLAIMIAVTAGLQLPRRVGWREVVVVAFAASSGFTFALFFATAVFPVGPILIQTKMGAMATGAGVLLALGTARLLNVGRFAAVMRTDAHS